MTALCSVLDWAPVLLLVVLGLIFVAAPLYMTFGGEAVEPFIKLKGKRRTLDLGKVFTPNSGGPERELHRLLLVAMLTTTAVAVALALLDGFLLQPHLCTEAA